MPRKRLNFEESLNILADEVKQTSQENEIDNLYQTFSLPVPYSDNHIQKPIQSNERKKDEFGFQIVKPRSSKTEKRPYSKYMHMLNFLLTFYLQSIPLHWLKPL